MNESNNNNIQMVIRWGIRIANLIGFPTFIGIIIFIFIFIVAVLACYAPFVLLSNDQEAVEIVQEYERAIKIIEEKNEAFIKDIKADEVHIETNMDGFNKELLIAIDATRYKQDISHIDKNDIINMADSFVERKVNYHKREETKKVKYYVSAEKAKDMKGVKKDGNSYYYYKTKVETIKIADVSIKSLSASEIYQKLNFTEEDILLCNQYLQFDPEDIGAIDYIGQGQYTTDGKGIYLFPVKCEEGAKFNITSPYGEREFYYEGRKIKGFHHGIDIALPKGVEILAAHDGVVTRSEYDSKSYGFWIEIKGGDGSLTRYAHNSQLTVAVGEEVNRGDRIALSGNTGRSTGPHLHFEIRRNGGTVDPGPLTNLHLQK